MTRKKMCKEPTCGVKTIHKTTFADNGLRHVWECTNCGHQTAIRVLTLGDVQKLAQEAR